MSNKLSHFDASGRAVMVDVSDKPPTARHARASGQVRMRKETLAQVLSGAAKKGDVCRLAELAGIMGAKQTSTLIPLCHPLPLTSLTVRIEPDSGLPGLQITAQARTTGPTGVEMEALSAVSIACLTIYDMLKGSDRGMEIGHIRLLEKSGGKSGDWVRS